MPDLSAADVSRVYNELTEATSPMTAEVVVYSVIATQRNDLLTKDYLDARLGTIDAKIDTSIASLDAKIDSSIASLDAKIDSSIASLDAKIDSGIARLDAKIDIGFERSDKNLERAMRQQIIWLGAAMFTFNGLLATWLTLVR